MASLPQGSWPKLIVRGLTKVFREQKTQILAVRDAWFTLDSGQVLGLLGPSGAGKTTVMNMLSGDLRPTDGTVSSVRVRACAWMMEMLIKRGFIPLLIFPTFLACKN